LRSVTTFHAIMKYMSWPKSAAVKDIDIDIDIADIFCQKYRYPIDIGKSDIDPALQGGSNQIPHRTKCISRQSCEIFIPVFLGLYGRDPAVCNLYISHSVSVCKHGYLIFVAKSYSGKVAKTHHSFAVPGLR